MNEHTDSEHGVEQAIGRLPRRIAPRRDLWPGIQARLGTQDAAPANRRPAWRLPAMAASVAIAFAAGLILGRGVDRPGMGEEGLVTDLDRLAMQGALQVSEREYQAAFQAFTPLGVDAAYLETGVAEGLQNSWADLLQAEEALLEALEEHPENRFIGEKLVNLRAQQLEFLRQIYMLDQNSRRKI